MKPNHVDEIETWVEQLERFLSVRFIDRELGRDLAQEAATRLLQGWKRGESYVNPRSWMFRIGRNLAIDHVRRKLPTYLGNAEEFPPKDEVQAPEVPTWQLGD